MHIYIYILRKPAEGLGWVWYKAKLIQGVWGGASDLGHRIGCREAQKGLGTPKVFWSLKEKNWGKPDPQDFLKNDGSGCFFCKMGGQDGLFQIVCAMLSRLLLLFFFFFFIIFFFFFVFFFFSLFFFSLFFFLLFLFLSVILFSSLFLSSCCCSCCCSSCMFFPSYFCFTDK